MRRNAHCLVLVSPPTPQLQRAEHPEDERDRGPYVVLDVSLPRSVARADDPRGTRIVLWPGDRDRSPLAKSGHAGGFDDVHGRDRSGAARRREAELHDVVWPLRLDIVRSL